MSSNESSTSRQDRPRQSNNTFAQITHGRAGVSDNPPGGLWVRRQKGAQTGGVVKSRPRRHFRFDGQYVATMLDDEIYLSAGALAPIVESGAGGQQFSLGAQVLVEQRFIECAQLAGLTQACALK